MSPALHESDLTLYILVLNAAINLQVGVLKFLWNTELAFVANSAHRAHGSGLPPHLI